MLARKREVYVYVLSNMHIPPAEGRFKENKEAVNHLVIKDYTTHMEHWGMLTCVTGWPTATA
jgi:hypothetical protein